MREKNQKRKILIKNSVAKKKFPYKKPKLKCFGKLKILTAAFKENSEPLSDAIYSSRLDDA